MLSPDQITARRGKLTASRVAVLMRGDAQGIFDLWREMTDDPTFIPEDLSQVWAVQLGATTEQLNLNFYEIRNHSAVTRRGEVVLHAIHDWAAATLDGFIDDLGYCIEAKHVGGREPLEVIIERYQPQMQWQMFVTNTQQIALSVIMGASAPIVEFIERDDAYIKEMAVRGEQFMQHVWSRTEPVALPPVPAPVIADRTVDMSASNTWVSSAADWLANRAAADVCKDAEKTMKSLVPEDAKKAFGAGARITRDRAGRLSLREDA